MPAGDSSDRGSFADARGIPVTASLVDQQAALFGHGCRRKGDAKITFGTGAFALAVAGSTGAARQRERPRSRPSHGSWATRRSPYALQGGIYNAASAVNWARSLGLFLRLPGDRRLHGRGAIARGLVFVPALSGLPAHTGIAAPPACGSAWGSKPPGPT
jgi:glycerol kinase